MKLVQRTQLLAAIAVLGIALPASAQTWNLVWSDEFNGPSGAFPDASRWSYDVGNNGGWGNGESEFYCAAGSNAAPCSAASPNAFMNGGGSLVIRARRDAGGTWTSTRMHTSGKFSVQYGRIEARMRLVAATGLWPAFWMLGSNIGSVGWPSCGETDIMEWVVNYGPSVTSSALHGPGYSGGGNIGVSAGFPNGTRVDDPGYHVYGVIWSPDQIQFYRDSTTNVIRTITPANLPGGATWAYNHPFFLILNQAVGGNWFPGPDGSTPAINDVLVDYVRVYQAGSSPPPPGGAVGIRASANNTFVSAENAGASPLVANRPTISAWEQFRVIDNGDGTISLQAVVNGRYVAADLENGGRLIASRTSIGTWEKFRRITQPNGTVALQALANDLYVAADLNAGNVLIASRPSPSTWEQFAFSPL
ncbi:MAG TPA: family 16 glycosylhydrolase [Kofleriaceae bacterium]|nr:family 16 glycosylhydrolase [Kofleriaceae bacterium]